MSNGTTSTTATRTGATALPAIGGTSTSTLSEYAGPYVTGMLGKAQALSEMPYQVYQGPLTAAASPLQTQAFQGIGSLTTPTGLGAAQQFATDVAQRAGGLDYTAGTFTPGTFGTQQAQQYMNPYLQAALNPAMDEARRQAEISRTQQAGRLAQAGAFGGSRQAIMESELNRNLMQAQNKMLGEGYASAYDKAMAQYNADMARALQAQQMGEQSRQFGATYGLQGLGQQLAAAQGLGSLAQSSGAEQRAMLAQQLAGGAQQRAIEQEGITADLNEFLQQRDYPMKQLQFQQSMLQGLPISTVTNTPSQMSGIGQLSSTVGGLGSIVEALKKLGQNLGG